MGIFKQLARLSKTVSGGHVWYKWFICSSLTATSSGSSISSYCKCHAEQQPCVLHCVEVGFEFSNQVQEENVMEFLECLLKGTVLFINSVVPITSGP